MTYAEAQKVLFARQPKPHGWIQWKGTNVCMDVRCDCGLLTHVDGEFAYFVQCPRCGRKYAVDGHVRLLEITEPEEFWPEHNAVHIAEDDEHLEDRLDMRKKP